jgi:hypothetical protein
LEQYHQKQQPEAVVEVNFQEKKYQQKNQGQKNLKVPRKKPRKHYRGTDR